MKNILLTTIIALMLVAPLGSALTSVIDVKAEPIHNVVLRAYNGPGGNLISTLVERADDKGLVQFELSTTANLLSIEITEIHPLTNDKTVTNYDDVPVRASIKLGFDEEPEEPEEEEVEEQPQEEVEEVTEEPTNEQEVEVTVEEPQEEVTESTQPAERSGLTGFIIAEDGSPAQGAYYLGIVALLVIGALVFVAHKMRQSVVATKDNTTDVEKELKDAQQKLKEAQAEIRDIKSKKSAELSAAEEEFRKAKEKLEKASGGKVDMSKFDKK